MYVLNLPEPLTRYYMVFAHMNIMFGLNLNEFAVRNGSTVQYMHRYVRRSPMPEDQRMWSPE